jgi:hypothetical protein
MKPKELWLWNRTIVCQMFQFQLYFIFRQKKNRCDTEQLDLKKKTFPSLVKFNEDFQTNICLKST